MALALSGMLLSDCFRVASVFLTAKRSWDLRCPKDCASAFSWLFLWGRWLFATAAKAFVTLCLGTGSNQHLFPDSFTLQFKIIVFRPVSLYHKKTYTESYRIMEVTYRVIYL